MAGAAAGDGKDVFRPKALLVRNEREDDDDWICTTFHKFSKELQEKHIVVTNDTNELETVHMTIIFLNATFVRNRHHLLEQFIENVVRRQMILITVVYENNDDSKLVTEVFSKFDGQYPRDFDFNSHDPERLTKLVHLLLNRTYTTFRKPSLNNNKITVGFKGTLESFIDQVVRFLNPFHLDFTEIPPDLLSEAVAMSHNIENVRKLGYTSCQPMLALFKYQPCQEHQCMSQTMTTVLRLLHTLNNIFYRTEFYLGRIYVSMPSPIETGEPPPSFATVLRSALKAQHPNRSFPSFSYLPFLIVIEDFQKFVPKGEDPIELLACILEQLGQGSLVITSFPNTLKLDTKCLGLVRGTPVCIHSPPNTIREPGPLCYTIFKSEFDKLAIKDFVMGEADSKETEEGQTKKNVHSTVFDVFGNMEKKLREAY